MNGECESVFCRSICIAGCVRRMHGAVGSSADMAIMHDGRRTLGINLSSGCHLVVRQVWVHVETYSMRMQVTSALQEEAYVTSMLATKPLLSLQADPRMTTHISMRVWLLVCTVTSVSWLGWLESAQPHATYMHVQACCCILLRHLESPPIPGERSTRSSRS